MGGKPGRSGRKAKPLAAHLLAHTYRRDRHGPKPDPAETGTPEIPSIPPAVLKGLHEAGRTLVVEQWRLYADWPPTKQVLLRQAAQAVDELEALTATIQAEGVVVSSTRGPAPHPLLRAQRMARAALVQLLGALEVDV